MKTVDFYWDLGSTNTYFALNLVKPIVARLDAELVLHPFNLGYVFRHHNYALTDEPAAKMRNRLRDLERWAQRYDLAFRMPDRFPIKTSRALRAAIAARRWDREAKLVDMLFARYWEHNDASVVENEGIARAAQVIGLDGQALIDAADSPEVRQALIDSTNTALEAGIFGAPTMVVDGEIFWGKDRMEFVEDALQS
ncbi:MAG: 2-hydroxychromene-2-carboxylate isomerase [Pseudomonadales bacterium]|nr:2-hydroxychromene-2-carboxylate isomerase [Pseudomonadales bacterium]MDP6471838.1 2-hydroxychromene-2-carboxylate isomerase [Pseudomonadales bacterium]MDP6828748.1 2-hydroxychromene-2-carboxylate isomerase [Pseudomonadales bacterium]MDP6970658.1 2-hydroxychromene-2-carboxylate isomerase [Pseudomonadales bacterium]